MTPFCWFGLGIIVLVAIIGLSNGYLVWRRERRP